MPILIDQTAKEIALRRWALPDCLHVPIAAVDEAAIRDHVGEIELVLSSGSPCRAFLVTVATPLTIDPLLPIHDHPNAEILHARRQVWVHIAFNRYRAAYRKAFPDEMIDGKVLSHALDIKVGGGVMNAVNEGQKCSLSLGGWWPRIRRGASRPAD